MPLCGNAAREFRQSLCVLYRSRLGGLKLRVAVGDTDCVLELLHFGIPLAFFHDTITVLEKNR